MMNSLHNVIQQYLVDRKLPKLRAWLAQNQWELGGQLLELVDQVDEALVYFDDGYIDEMGLRRWVLTILTDHSLATVSVNWQEQAQEKAFVQQGKLSWVFHHTHRNRDAAQGAYISLTA